MHMKACGNVYVCKCGIRLCSLGALKRHCKQFDHEPQSLEPMPEGSSLLGHPLMPTAAATCSPAAAASWPMANVPPDQVALHAHGVSALGLGSQPQQYSHLQHASLSEQQAAQKAAIAAIQAQSSSFADQHWPQQQYQQQLHAAAASAALAHPAAANPSAQPIASMGMASAAGASATGAVPISTSRHPPSVTQWYEGSVPADLSGAALAPDPAVLPNHGENGVKAVPEAIASAAVTVSAADGA